MTKCSQCGKEIGIWNSSFKKEVCNKCFSIFPKKDKKEELEPLNKQQKEIAMKSKDMIKEIKCECNQCGKVWHYLEEEEKSLKSQQVGNLMVGAGMCCNPFGAYFMNKSVEQGRQRQEKFNKCPDCNSIDITKTPVYHEKKS